MQKKISKNEYFELGFRLNMRILADALEGAGLKVQYYERNNQCRLENVKIPRGGNLLSEYVYIIPAEEVDGSYQKYYDQSMIVIGKVEPDAFSEDTSLIIVEDEEFPAVFDMIQETFEKYQKWDWELQRGLNSPCPLDEMLLASMKIFRNPMFIHDTSFFILSAPKHVPGMLEWETDARTGMQIAPASLVNDFKVDQEYLETLKSKESSMFSANQRGYRILYRNLWKGNHYQGRILVDEILDTILPGDYYTLEYLGNLIESVLNRKDLFWMNMGTDIEHFFKDMLDGRLEDAHQMQNYLTYLGWNWDDQYLCLRIITEQRDFSMVSSSVTLGSVEAQISSGHALWYDNAIVAIINLSYDHSTPAQVLSKLAIVLREGLLKIGVSSEINDFGQMVHGYVQAKIALELGRISDSTTWCYYFDDYMLDYVAESAVRELPVELVCADKLQTLLKYDEANHTEFYHTLKVYLKGERNALQTSKDLFIHRSTLFYRLDRINKLTGLDLDNPNIRLKLLISYYMLDGKE